MVAGHRRTGDTIEANRLQVQGEEAHQIKHPLKLGWPGEGDVADDAHVLKHADRHSQRTGGGQHRGGLGGLLHVHHVVECRNGDHADDAGKEPTTKAEWSAICTYICIPRLASRALGAGDADTSPGTCPRQATRTRLDRKASVDIEGRGSVREEARLHHGSASSVACQTLGARNACTCLVAGVATADDTLSLVQLTLAQASIRIESAS